jgi:hypothetical protein
LAQASKQGSILQIKFKGKVYGSGGYGSMVNYSLSWMVMALVATWSWNACCWHCLDYHSSTSLQERASAIIL